MTNLLGNIMASAWMIHEDFARGHMPFLAELMKGNNPELYKSDEKPESRTNFVNSEGRLFSRWDLEDEEETQSNLVAVHNVNGVITMDDQFCGPRGTITLMKELTNADNNDAVLAHIISANSGGGEATNIQTVFNHIRNNIKKPVLVSTRGMAASAMYFIAAAADEIYAEQETTIFGSIGVVMSIYDFSAALEKAGINIIEVLATKSTDKRKMYEDAIAGDFTLLRSKILDPHQRIFESSIRSARQITDEEVFSGQVYTAVESIENGLIDGILTEQEVIARAFELGTQHNTQNNISNHNTIGMKYNNLAKATAMPNLTTDKEGGVYLNAETADALEAYLGTLDPEAVATADDKAEKATEKVVHLNAKVTDLETKLADLDAKFEALAAEPATPPATQPAAAEAATEVDDYWAKQDEKYGLK